MFICIIFVILLCGLGSCFNSILFILGGLLVSPMDFGVLLLTWSILDKFSSEKLLDDLVLTMFFLLVGYAPQVLVMVVLNWWIVIFLHTGFYFFGWCKRHACKCNIEVPFEPWKEQLAQINLIFKLYLASTKLYWVRGGMLMIRKNY